MSDYKETAVVNVPKESFADLKDDSGFREHIVKHISTELADRVMDILEYEKEVIVRQSDLRVNEFRPTNSVEYRRQINWSPLVRCKDCMYRDGNICDYSAVYVRPNGYCQWGRSKDGGGR